MRRSRLIAVIFYGGLLVLLAAIVFKVLGDVLPKTLARKIGGDSEGFVMALTIGAWIQFVRPRLAGSTWEWPVTLAVALAFVAVGVALRASDLPGQIKTLNEAFMAGALVAYLQPRRPVPRWLPIAIALVTLAVIVFASHTQLVTDLAEALGVVILLPLTVDIFDREILDPSAPISPAMRYGWYAALVIVPLAFTVSHRAVDVDGAFNATTRYGIRLQESFVCLLLVVGYFALRRIVHRPPNA